MSDWATEDDRRRGYELAAALGIDKDTEAVDYLCTAIGEMRNETYAHGFGAGVMHAAAKPDDVPCRACNECTKPGLHREAHDCDCQTKWSGDAT